jgi:hypothetical protein
LHVVDEMLAALSILPVFVCQYIKQCGQFYVQGLMNSLYSQPFGHYNTQQLNLQAPQQQPQQGQGTQNQKIHYNG